MAVDGLAVFAYGNVISARRLTDGSQVWQRAFPGAKGSSLGEVGALTGAVRWRAKTVGGVDDVAVTRGGMIVVGTSGPSRLTLLRPDGELVWSVPENVANGVTWVDTGTDLIYVSSDSSTSVATRLVDRRLSTGAARWSTTLGGDGTDAVVVRPAGGNLVVAEALGPPSTSAFALAVNPGTGYVRATTRLAALGDVPLTVVGGDTLMELTAAACPEAPGAVGATVAHP